MLNQRHTLLVGCLVVCLLESCQSVPPTKEQIPWEGDIAYSVIDLKSGQEIDAQDSQTPRPPASTAKIFVAARALASLGKDYRFRTQVYSSKKAVFLVGGGDPLLTHRDLMELARISAPKLKGMKQLYFDSSRFEPTTILESDVDSTASYNASVSALGVEFNQAFAQGTSKAWVLIPPVADASLVELSDTPRAELVRVPVREPALLTALLFARALEREGVKLSAPTFKPLPKKSKLVGEHLGIPLWEVVANMLEYSTNLSAELLGLEASLGFSKKSKRPLNIERASQQTSLWAQREIGSKTLSLKNHSGLSLSSAVTPRELSSFLRQHLELRPLLASYGWKWKRKSPFAHPQSVFEIFSKSGSLDCVVNLAGFLYTKSGRWVTFSLLIQNLRERDATKTLPGNLQGERLRRVKSWEVRAYALQEQILSEWWAKL